MTSRPVATSSAGLTPAASRRPSAGFNMMSLPLASRPGLQAAARHWLDPHEDLERGWREVISAFPGLLALARGCRSWLSAPGPDPELLGWLQPALGGDRRLLDYFE